MLLAFEVVRDLVVVKPVIVIRSTSKEVVHKFVQEVGQPFDHHDEGKFVGLGRLPALDVVLVAEHDLCPTPAKDLHGTRPQMG